MLCYGEAAATGVLNTSAVEKRLTSTTHFIAGLPCKHNGAEADTTFTNGWHFENTKQTEFGDVLRPSMRATLSKCLPMRNTQARWVLTRASVDVSTSRTRIMIFVVLTYRRERQSLIMYLCTRAKTELVS